MDDLKISLRFAEPSDPHKLIASPVVEPAEPPPARAERLFAASPFSTATMFLRSGQHSAPGYPAG